MHAIMRTFFDSLNTISVDHDNLEAVSNLWKITINQIPLNLRYIFSIPILLIDNSHKIDSSKNSNIYLKISLYCNWV